MAGNQLARKSADAFDISDWMAQRRADVQRLLQGAEAEGRRLWAESTATGQAISAPTPQDVRALGAQALGADQVRSPTVAGGRVGSTWWDHTPLVKAVGGTAARALGNTAGIVRAGVHDAQGMRDSAVLAGRILNPLDRVVNPPDQKPLQPIINAANHIVDYGFNAAVHPGSLLGDARKQLQKWNTELDPAATPEADTLGGEFARNFRIGADQGELGAEMAALAFGSGALKVVPRLAPISEAAGAAKFMKQGFGPRQAARLARPYEGKGHHFVPNRYELLPPWLSDSIFNVLKPSNISQGDFYELHYKVDPHFHGAAIKRGSRGWSGKALGLKDKRYGLLERLWHGSPAPLNAAAGVVGGGGLAEHENDDGDGS